MGYTMTEKPALTTGDIKTSESKRLTCQDILGAKRRTMTLEVIEWGGAVTLQELSANDRSDIESEAYASHQANETFDLKAWRTKFVVLSVIDADGKRMFEGDAEIAALGDMSYSAVNRIFEAALEFNGMQDKTVAQAQDFTEAQPNASLSD